MTPTPKTKTKISPSRIPITLLIPLVILAILYSFFQPWANARFGLKLPSIVQILSSDKKPQAPASGPDAPHADPKLQSAESNAGEISPYEILRKTAAEVYVSAEGLRYTRGSEEGHRIKHLARHLEDMPDRSGNHGVFEGGWQIALNRIDDAYRRSKQSDSKTKVRKEEDRLIIETEFDEVIGYIGGKEGARKGNPTTRRLRLVTEGDRFITAFPY